MKEFKFIELLKPLSQPSPEGIGDDAAVLGDYIISMDIMTEGIHFTMEQPVEEVLNHLLVSNISDIAAMGGKKGGYKVLFGVAVPPDYDKVMISRALTKLTKEYDVTLIGGDTATSMQGASLSLTIIGHKGSRVLTRDGAQKGDVVYVSRPLGAGKYAMQRKTGILGGHPDIDYRFTPEQELGELLSSIEGVTSCIDISDGLGIDMSHIASSSDVKVVIEEGMVPVANLRLHEKEKLEYALSSGEEYCLAFTVSADKAEAVEQAIEEKLGRRMYKVGIIEAGDRCWLRKKDGKMVDISRIGYEHD